MVTEDKTFDIEALPLRTKRIIGGVAVLLVAGAVTLLLVLGGGEADDSAGGGDAPLADPEIIETPSPVPSQSIDEMVEELGGGLDHDDHDHDHDQDEEIDVQAEQAFALAAVREWANWDSNETPEARRARLLPYFGERSPMLAEDPVTANRPARIAHEARTLTQVESDGFAGIVLATDEVVTLDVTYRFKSIAEYDGYRLNYSEGAVWRVELPRGLPDGSVIVDMTEPDIAF